jgi:hypothetical protein
MMNKKLVGLKGGSDATFFEVLQVLPATITTYPSVKDGKLVSWAEMDSNDLMKYKKKITIDGYNATVTGNAVMAEKMIEKALNDECSAFAIGPNTVQIYKKSDFENAIKG